MYTNPAELLLQRKGQPSMRYLSLYANSVGMLLAAYDSIATVSSVMHGEYGIEDVCYKHTDAW